VADARINPEVNPAYPYTSPENASFCVMEAVHAAEPGDTVMVLPGTYGSPGVSYWLENGIDLMGSGSDRTLVLASVSVWWDSMLSAFRFKDTGVQAGGGALINDCVFDGAWVEVYSAAALRRCVFLGVPDSRWRPAVEIMYGAGTAVLDCVFELPAQEVAIRAFETEDLLVAGCKFTGCQTAVFWFDGSASGTVRNCVFTNNREAVRMDVSPVAVENCTFFSNDYAVWVGWQCDPGPHINNSILWGSTCADIFVDRSDGFGIPTVTFSNVQSGWAGLGNISRHPQFAYSGVHDGDFHLMGLSPCIDAGDPFSDYSNEPKPNGQRVNMGACGNTWRATDSHMVDLDRDNLRDDWEIENFGNLDRDGPGDADNDGLSDRGEYRYLSDPKNPDSDDDGLRDGDEVRLVGTDPIVPDTDNDGTPDGKEVAQGTDPLDPWDAFTIMKFWIENDQVHVVHSVHPDFWYQLQSSFFPNGPFGTLVGMWAGRHGVLTHTFVGNINPHTRFFRVEARPR